MGLLMGGGLLPMFGASGAANIPASIANLWAWWDIATLSTLYQDSAGSTPVTGDGDPIGYIADRSGNGRYVRQTGATGTRPTYTTGVQNGLAAATFDGGDYLDTVATVDSTPLTIIGVLKRSAVGSLRGVVTTYHLTNTGARVYTEVANTIVANAGGPTKATTATFGANVAVVFGARFQGSGLAVFTNGTIENASGSLSTINNIFAMARIAVNSTSVLLIGSLCEIIVYSRALTDTEITNLSTYLNTKWSVY